MELATPISVGLSVRVLGVLFLALLASGAIFSVLVRRSTVQRRRVSLEEWARSAKLKFTQGSADLLPELLQRLKPVTEHVMLLEGSKLQIVRVEMKPVSVVPGEPVLPPVVWKLLIAPTPRLWSASGVRPEGARQSVIDLFSLSSFPTMGGTERFVVYAVDSDAAKDLPQSSIRSLLPSDLGLVMLGSSMILDFSSRRFDELEFQRLLPLAKQLSQRVG